MTGTGPRILTLDIESAPHDVHAWALHDVNVGLNQIVKPGFMLCFAAKWKGDRTVQFYSVLDDGVAKMRENAHRLLDEADAVISYNGKSYDMKHLRRELLLGGFLPPSPWVDIDLLQTVRSRFKFASSKLDFVCQQLGIGAKMQHSGHELWVQCLAGDPQAWAVMERYCKRDVVLTEKLYFKLLPWLATHPNLNLWSEGEGCPSCSSDRLQRRGFARRGLSVCQRFQCQACGRWVTDGARVSGAKLRAAV